MILVDTNVWSETSKPNGNRKVVSWIEGNRHDLWLSTIVIAELQAGIENPDAAHKRAGLEEWFAKLQTANANRILPFDIPAAFALGKLLPTKPQDVKMLDIVLAAQALSRDCPIATRNLRDFEGLGIELIDPWSG